MNPSATENTSGLTLVEMVLVLSIMVALASVALPSLTSIQDSRREDETDRRMAALGIGLEALARDFLQLPTTLDPLVTSPAGSTRWRGPYAESRVFSMGPHTSFKVDTWGRPYTWVRSSTLDGALTSRGRDGRSGTADDRSLTVDIRPILREITAERVARINIAIRNYNGRWQVDQPLQGTSADVLARLRAAGLLPLDTSLNSDGFSDPWNVDGQPVTSFYSNNLLLGQIPNGGSGR